MARIAVAAATRDPAAAAESLARSKALGYAMNPKALAADVKRFEELLKQFVESVGGTWGKDVEVSTPKKYVKYTQNYASRASVDFDTGMIVVETVDQKSPRESLRTAIVTTLLTPDDPRSVDLFSSAPVPLGDTPFLLGEVKDHDNKDIRWEWRAGRYADRLMNTALKTRTIATDKGETTALSVEIPMVRDHLGVRARKYRTLVTEAAERFKVSRNLIYAIMKVESDFNPFAVSSAMAIGLMQVVPSTAGQDVYRFLNGKQGAPTRESLQQPPTNITYGTAYLHLLQNKLLEGISDPVSREYCVIAGYNGGPTAVLRSFGSTTTRSKNTINSLPPGQVYAKLLSNLPAEETRRYLEKVLAAKKQFVNF